MPGGTIRILLIEDDPMIGRSLTAVLGDDGYAVDWVRNGASAIAAPGFNRRMRPHSGRPTSRSSLGLVMNRSAMA